IVAERFDAEKRGELFVHPQYGVLPAGAQHVVSVVDFLQHGLELSTKPFVETETEEVGNLIRGQPHQSDIARAFIQLMDWKVALENEVPAILDLLNRKQPVEIDSSPFFFGKLGSEGKTPVVEPLADDVGAQTIGSGLQCLWIGNR